MEKNIRDTNIDYNETPFGPDFKKRKMRKATNLLQRIEQGGASDPEEELIKLATDNRLRREELARRKESREAAKEILGMENLGSPEDKKRASIRRILKLLSQ